MSTLAYVPDGQPIPHGRTARRLEWPHLPPALRDLVEKRLGSPVSQAVSQGAGFTPGFASRLTGEDGSRLFVKAANKVAQGAIAASYLEEARMLQRLPVARLPAPGLRWVHEDDLWVVLGIEDVEGQNPVRPWVESDLDRALAALTTVAAVMDPVPVGLGLKPLHHDLPTLVTGWDRVAESGRTPPHFEEVRDLASSFGTLPGAGYFAHADVRDDNLILTADGRALLCDWNWPALGPHWFDMVTLLLSAHGDGVDVDPILAEHPLTRDVPADHIDASLAAMCSYMAESELRPSPANSPFLGVHRRWWLAASWSWLAERRSWA